jgi:hypothetical protein
LEATRRRAYAHGSGEAIQLLDRDDLADLQRSPAADERAVGARIKKLDYDPSPAGHLFCGMLRAREKQK